MSVTLTYDDVLSRIRIEASDLDDSPTVAEYATVERSHNELLWLPVRGGLAVPVTSGSTQLDDYEFFPLDDAGQANFYRVRSFDEDDNLLQEYTNDITAVLTSLWLKSPYHAQLNLAVTPSEQGDVELADRGAAFPISGRSLPVGVADLPGGRDHVLALVTRDRAEEDKLLIRLRVASLWFVHVPGMGPLAEMLPGSMHVLVGRPRKHRAGGVSAWNVFSLPLTETVAPGPEVVSSTLTVGTVWARHGTVAEVWSAYPTLRDLWETVGDPSDLLAL